ncbi:30S ribosomal protein S10 [Candidatus Johnevansia muelleri]|uniref:Small ribosomal subunit protein uS10 n=1 Tax=Candidatus Johnevansia muelleri TaxID=1495769 RepID=A0A078KB12_9GAMM|nr:30S ribosomal protein S10 [Candidatus Evansia muelleri]
MQNKKLKIRLKSFDYHRIDNFAKVIINEIKSTGAKISGPIPLPTNIKKYTVLISPHVNKDARDQYEIRTHNRILYILSPTIKTIDILLKMDIHIGVYLQVNI